MPKFIPGLELGRLFHSEAVKPILDATIPGLQYSAALLGDGSEILGFDTEMSTDHHWGPRAMHFHPDVKRIAGRKLIGSLDQFSDSTDILSDSKWRTTLRRLYE